MIPAKHTDEGTTLVVYRLSGTKPVESLHKHLNRKKVRLGNIYLTSEGNWKSEKMDDVCPLVKEWKV